MKNLLTSIQLQKTIISKESCNETIQYISIGIVVGMYRAR